MEACPEMGEYNVLVAPAFKREFKKLSTKIQKKILKRLDEMTVNPRPRGVEKLSQDPRFWRTRIGDYRMVYAIDDEQSVIVACLIRHRKDAYRDIEKLDARLVFETLKPLLVSLRAIPSESSSAS